ALFLSLEPMRAGPVADDVPTRRLAPGAQRRTAAATAADPLLSNFVTAPATTQWTGHGCAPTDDGVSAADHARAVPPAGSVERHTASLAIAAATPSTHLPSPAPALPGAPHVPGAQMPIAMPAVSPAGTVKL